MLFDRGRTGTPRLSFTRGSKRSSFGLAAVKRNFLLGSIRNQLAATAATNNCDKLSEIRHQLS